MKKRISIIVCLMFSFAFILIGIMISNGHFQHKDEYIFNQSSDIKHYIKETLSCDDIENMSTHEDDSILVVAAKTNDDQHIFDVFEQLNNGRYKEIYQYYRSFDMAYLLEFFDYHKTIIGIPNYDDHIYSMEIVWQNKGIQEVNVNQSTYDIQIYKTQEDVIQEIHFFDKQGNRIFLNMIDRIIKENES